MRESTHSAHQPPLATHKQDIKAITFLHFYPIPMTDILLLNVEVLLADLSVNSSTPSILFTPWRAVFTLIFGMRPVAKGGLVH